MSSCKRAASKCGYKWEMPLVVPEDCALLPKLVWSLHVTCDFSSVQHLGVCLSQPPMAVPLPFCVDSLLCDGPWLPVRVTWAGWPPSAPTRLRPRWRSLHFLCTLLFGHVLGICWLCCVYSQICTLFVVLYCLVFCQKKIFLLIIQDSMNKPQYESFKRRGHLDEWGRKKENFDHPWEVIRSPPSLHKRAMWS